jgi:hypothetical protein
MHVEASLCTALPCGVATIATTSPPPPQKQSLEIYDSFVVADIL